MSLKTEELAGKLRAASVSIASLSGLECAAGWMGGPAISGLVLVEDEKGSVGWKRCSLHNGAGYLSASIDWRACDIPG